jgi:flagellar biosynthesis/type III secretory pathway protein FliH
MWELERLAEQIRRERFEAASRAEDELILIALEAAKRVMRQQCRVDSDAVSKMLEEILLENEGVTKLYLSEFQNTLAFRLDKNITRKIRRFASDLKTVLVRDNEDGIMLESENGVTDVSVPTQLELLKRAVLGKNGVDAER